MRHIHDSAESLTLLLKLNWDRLLYIGVLILALNIGGFINLM